GGGRGTDRRGGAGVGAFGMSGTNVHVILEEAPEPEPESPEPAAPAQAPAVVPHILAGRTAAALRDQAIRLAARLAAEPSAHPVDVGHSLATSRTAFEHRAVVVAGQPPELLAGLAALVRGETAVPGVVTGCTDPAVGKTVLVFPGQGAQWAGMARELLTESTVFAASMADCEQALSGLLDWSLLDVVREKPGVPSLERVDVVQPALFAVMVSLAALWRSWGVEP